MPKNVKEQPNKNKALAINNNKMKKKKVIGIIGEQAGGKGAVADLIVEKFGGARLTTSDILKKILDNLYLEYNRDNLTELALSLKDSFGKDILMKAMLEEVKSADEELVIVDGIRMKGDTDPFEKEYGPNFKLIYVTADPKIRYERSKSRGEKKQESSQDYETFLEKEKTGTEKDIAEIGQKAYSQINNNGTWEELEKQVLETISLL